MIIPDINLLLYAYDSSSAFHAKAVTWWQSCLSGKEPIGLPPVVVFGFVRIGTNARVYENPLSVADAIGHVHSWLAQPVVQSLAPDAGHVEKVLLLLHNLGTAANLVTDAQIAALTLEYGAILHTADTDFVRFQGLRWFNPLTGTGSRDLRGRSKI